MVLVMCAEDQFHDEAVFVSKKKMFHAVSGIFGTEKEVFALISPPFWLFPIATSKSLPYIVKAQSHVVEEKQVAPPIWRRGFHLREVKKPFQSVAV